ncbi:MAG: hypothetical protein MJ003_06980, partial [Paludibacteraceae bacterium]|nr:hypothetical protein [Paludibacteraceae bacterium]
METTEIIKDINIQIQAVERELSELKKLVSTLESQSYEEPVMATEPVKVAEPVTIAEPVKTEEPVTEQHHVDGRLIADLHKAIGLNDRIRFQRELFHGDAGLMNATVDFLNAVSSYTEAIKYLNENF